MEGKKRISSLRFGLRPARGGTVRSRMNGGNASKVAVSKKGKQRLKLKPFPPFIPPLGRAPEALGLEIRFFPRGFY
ncbi:hypothetical protein PMI05_03248 [Brevibacillus sp. BC25]|nr:hypothetical protein PMI05_03248 [Brevibacillus sp. BC25]